MTKKYPLECLGEDVVMIVDKKNKRVAFDGWDEEAEEAWLAIGGDEPSPCWIVARALAEDRLDEALVDAVENADLTLVSALLAAGANAARNSSDALIAACDIPHDNPDGNKIVRALVEAGANAAARIQCALRRAVATGDHSLMRFLLKKDNWVHGNVFTDALHYRDMTAFYMLLDNAKTVETGHNTALSYAISMRDEKIVADLLKAGAGDTLSLENHFIIAVQDGTPAIIALLLKKDPSLIKHGGKAVHNAAKQVAITGRERERQSAIAYVLEKMHEAGLVKFDPIATKMGSDAQRGDYSTAADWFIDKYRR